VTLSVAQRRYRGVLRHPAVVWDTQEIKLRAS
jgi:hypothetical protein